MWSRESTFHFLVQGCMLQTTDGNGPDKTGDMLLLRAGLRWFCWMISTKWVHRFWLGSVSRQVRILANLVCLVYDLFTCIYKYIYICLKIWLHIYHWNIMYKAAFYRLFNFSFLNITLIRVIFSVELKHCILHAWLTHLIIVIQITSVNSNFRLFINYTFLILNIFCLGVL